MFRLTLLAVAVLGVAHLGTSPSVPSPPLFGNFKVTSVSELEAEEVLRKSVSESSDITVNVQSKESNYPPNYGDLVHLGRRDGDVLLARETVINRNGDTNVELYGFFPVREITEVRSLNFGDEKGYTNFISSSKNGDVDVYITIPRGDSVRMFIEVYGIV